MTSTENGPLSTGLLRRATRIATGASMLGFVAGSVLLAGPARANVPEGWATGSTDVDTGHALLLLVGAPLGLFLVITLAVMLPSLARGEKSSGGAHGPDPEWFGGPRKSNDELAAPDTEESQAGGASGKW